MIILTKQVSFRAFDPQEPMVYHSLCRILLVAQSLRDLLDGPCWSFVW